MHLVWCSESGLLGIFLHAFTMCSFFGKVSGVDFAFFCVWGLVSKVLPQHVWHCCSGNLDVQHVWWFSACISFLPKVFAQLFLEFFFYF